jgi:hypothetical protein
MRFGTYQTSICGIGHGGSECSGGRIVVVFLKSHSGNAWLKNRFLFIQILIGFYNANAPNPNDHIVQDLGGSSQTTVKIWPDKYP